MGWDTQITILVEHIREEELEIAKEIFESDAKDYFHNGISFIKYRFCEDGSKVLFFTYERRKYLPYWTMQEVSKKFSRHYFTVIASSPDFIGGPAGIVKIADGQILDSYGVFERFGDHSTTTKALENPNPEVLFQCFGKNKLEETIRDLYLGNLPKQWVDERYADNLLEFTTEERGEFMNLAEQFKNRTDSWIEINPDFGK